LSKSRESGTGWREVMGMGTGRGRKRTRRSRIRRVIHHRPEGYLYLALKCRVWVDFGCGGMCWEEIGRVLKHETIERPRRYLGPCLTKVSSSGRDEKKACLFVWFDK
jgi:hypothetical protein